MLPIAVFAQDKDKNLPKGNEEFIAKNYTEAEADYRISQSKKRENAIAAYNLGNSIYMQKQSGEAGLSYMNSLKHAKTRPEKHQAFHNLGNTYMQQKDYTKAVEAYKNALRNDPNDEESRYNYALAKKMLKDNPPKKDDKKDKKDDKKDKKDDKKDKKDDKKDGDKDKKDEKKKDDKKDGDKDKKDGKGDEDKKQGEPKPKPGGISKERLQNLMEAVNNEEKKIQDKVNAKKMKGKPVQTEKDW